MTERDIVTVLKACLLSTEADVKFTSMVQSNKEIVENWSIFPLDTISDSGSIVACLLIKIKPSGNLLVSDIPYNKEDINRFEILCNCMTNVDEIVDVKNNTTLHIASMNGNLDMVKHLISLNANPLRRNTTGETPLHKACLHRNYNVIDYLCKIPSTVNAMNKYRETPLYVLISYRLCYDRIQDENFTESDENKMIDAIKILVENGASVNATNITRTPPIFNTIHNIAVMSTIIQLGAKLDLIDKMGNTLISTICGFSSNSDTDLLERMINLGTPINFHNKRAKLCISEAIKKNNERYIPILLKYGANINSVDIDGLSALHMACKVNNKRAVKVLMENGADINIENDKGETPAEYPIELNESIAIIITNGSRYTKASYLPLPQIIIDNLRYKKSQLKVKRV